MVGVWHLARRLREYFRHYAYRPYDIHYSVTREEQAPEQPFTRFSAYAFLAGGYIVSLGVGPFIGWHSQNLFSPLSLLFLHPVPTVIEFYLPTAPGVSDSLLYPPLAV